MHFPTEIMIWLPPFPYKVKNKNIPSIFNYRTDCMDLKKKTSFVYHKVLKVSLLFCSLFVYCVYAIKNCIKTFFFVHFHFCLNSNRHLHTFNLITFFFGLHVTLWFTWLVFFCMLTLYIYKIVVRLFCIYGIYNKV